MSLTARIYRPLQHECQAMPFTVSRSCAAPKSACLYQMLWLRDKFVSNVWLRHFTAKPTEVPKFDTGPFLTSVNVGNGIMGNFVR